MKVNEITMVYLEDYVSSDGPEIKLKQYLDGAKNYCKEVTGLSMETIEESESLTDFILMYVQQMYDDGFVEFNPIVKEMLTMQRNLYYEV